MVILVTAAGTEVHVIAVVAWTKVTVVALVVVAAAAVLLVSFSSRTLLHGVSK